MGGFSGSSFSRAQLLRWLPPLALVAALAGLAPALSRAQAGSADHLTPRGLVAEHALEYRWSAGVLWSLLPAPGVPLELRIRVGENYQMRAIRADGERVLVVWLPHAAGTDTGSEIVARLVAARGWAVASLLPPPDLPRPGAPLEAWVALAEERIRAGREALQMFATDDRVCVVVMGVSVGGIAALRVAELEPRVNAVVAMLAGSGSDGFAHAAHAYGASEAPLARAELSRLDALDPAQHAASLDARPRLLIRAALDDVISADSFTALRTALGNPDVSTYATGHESFVYVMPFAVRSGLDWISRVCARRDASASFTTAQ